MKHIKIISGILIVFFFFSCRSKVIISEAEFKKVALGMTPDEVRGVLGEPNSIRQNVDSGFSFFYIVKQSLLEEDRGHIYFNKKKEVYYLHYGDVD